VNSHFPRRSLSREKDYFPRILILLVALSFGAFCRVQARLNDSTFRHVSTGKPAIGDYFGTRVFDPFRWMEAGPSNALLRVRESDGSVRTLLDPEVYRRGGQHAAIDYFEPSPDGTYVAVGVSLGGSEDSTLYFLDVSAGKALSEAISRTQYGWPSWRSDRKSLFYFRQQKLPSNAPTSGSRIYCVFSSLKTAPATYRNLAT